MRQNNSIVEQEFGRIAAEQGWMTKAAEDGGLYDPELKAKFEEHLEQKYLPSYADLVRKSPQQYQSLFNEWLGGYKGPMPARPAPAGARAMDLVSKIQARLSGYSPFFRNILATPKTPDGVDGLWGKKTLDALQAAEPLVGPVFGGLLRNLTAAAMPGSQALMDILAALDKMPAETAPKASTPAPEAGKEEKMPAEHIPTALVKEPHKVYPAADELVPTASIVNELITLANDLDEMGEAKIAEAVDAQLRIYKQAVDKLYDITGETGEKLIGEAHPGGGPVQVPAKDEGGKVETVVEQQKKDVGAATSEPTGKQAAFVAKQLVALANRLDAEGKTEAALLVDKTLAELREGSARPFVVREAAIGLVGAIDLLLKELNDLFVKRDGQPYYYAIKDFLRPLKTYQDGIYNAQQAGKSEETARLVHAFEKDFSTGGSLDGETLVNEAPGGTQRLVRSLVQAIWSGIIQEKQKSPDLFAKLEATKSGTPAPQAGKPEQKPEQKPKGPALSVEVQRLQGTVKAALAAFAAAQGGPNREKLFKAFGGMERALAIKQALEKMKANLPRYNEVQAAKFNDFVWNRIYKPLQQAGLLTRAALESVLLRQAQDVPPELAGLFGKPGAKPGAKPGVRPGTKGAPARKSNLVLQQLQNAMMAAGIPLPRYGADGLWGTESWQAWNTLRDAIIERKGPGWDIGRPPAPAGKGPSDAAINAALNMARHLGRLYSARATVRIAPGVQVPERSLVDAQAFIKALSALPNSGVSPKGSPRENAAAALRLAQAYGLELEREDSDESWSLAREGVDARARAAVISRLVGQLKALETGIPSYRMPGGAAGQPGQPGPSGYGRGGYGREGEGIGELGTLEGGPGRTGRGTPRTAPAMSLEDQVYNVPDVSGFVNDSAQFAAWSQRYWMSKGGAEGEPYVVAHKVIEYLRKLIAVLQNRVMTAPVRDRASLQNILRQRHEAVNDVYSVLPKGR